MMTHFNKTHNYAHVKKETVDKEVRIPILKLYLLIYTFHFAANRISGMTYYLSRKAVGSILRQSSFDKLNQFQNFNNNNKKREKKKNLMSTPYPNLIS